MAEQLHKSGIRTDNFGNNTPTDNTFVTVLTPLWVAKGQLFHIAKTFKQRFFLFFQSATDYTPAFLAVRTQQLHQSLSN
ncbi:hypothetical protein D3C86_2039700 [compost metagenome]